MTAAGDTATAQEGHRSRTAPATGPRSRLTACGAVGAEREGATCEAGRTLSPDPPPADSVCPGRCSSPFG